MKLRDTISDAIVWPQGINISDEPVRRVHTRARRRNTSLVYSTLPLGMRVSESGRETRFLQVAQLDPGVSCVRAQPCWLRVVEEGKIRRRAPDCAVMYDGRAEMHEVKQDEECWKADVRSELLAVRDEVERHPGWRYSVSLKSVLIAEPLRSNTDLLWRHLKPEDEIDGGLKVRTTEILDDGPVTAAELIEQTRRPDDGPSGSGSWDNLLTMVAGRIIDFDVSERFTLDSIVWNRRSGPPRRRTLPFGTVEEAIVEPAGKVRPAPFCAFHIRGAAR